MSNFVALVLYLGIGYYLINSQGVLPALGFAGAIALVWVQVVRDALGA